MAYPLSFNNYSKQADLGKGDKHNFLMVLLYAEVSMELSWPYLILNFNLIKAH